MFCSSWLLQPTTLPAPWSLSGTEEGEGVRPLNMDYSTRHLHAAQSEGVPAPWDQGNQETHPGGVREGSFTKP